jgi:hypothetical protein
MERGQPRGHIRREDPAERLEVPLIVHCCDARHAAGQMNRLNTS